MLIPAALRFGSIKIHQDQIYFEESRPQQGGKTFLMCFDPKKHTSPIEALPPEVELRTKVNEYGGCRGEVGKEGIYFVEKTANQIWIYTPEKGLKQLTHSPHRFAELLETPHGIVAVQEKAFAEDAAHASQKLVLISPHDGSIQILHTGADFYSNPTFHEDRISFISWSHPHMPWNENTLWQAILTPTGLKEPRMISTEKGISHFAPQYLLNGSLLFSSDETGFWNLYTYQNGKKSPLTSLQIEIGYPQWVFGLSCFSVMKESIHWIGCDQAIWKKGTVDPTTLKVEFETTEMTSLSQQRSNETLEAWIESSSDCPPQLVYREANSTKKIIRRSLEGNFSTYPKPQSLKGTFSSREVQGFYYSGESKEPSPLLIRCHGGPTAMSSDSYDPKIAFWIAKGFSLFDINYTGSCGFGKKFRDLLNGHWGEYDWRDAQNWAGELIRLGFAKQDSLFISGSSAGGFTALCAAARSKVFAGATSYYGISDLVMLHKTTHRFESHYDQTLIGRFSESKKLYEKRSPLYYLEEWQTPTLFLQGEEDKVVPPDQSMNLYEELIKRGVKTEIKIYPEEGHGFRKYENQMDSLEREWRFYNEILLSKKPRS